MVTMQALAACIMIAANTYAVPPQEMFGIYEVERVAVGQIAGPNQNGSYDIVPMQINTLWIPELAEMWGVPVQTAYYWVRDDACTNAGVAAWIMRRNLNETNGNLAQAVSWYHSRTPQYGNAYRTRVYKAMVRKGLLPAGG